MVHIENVSRGRALNKTEQFIKSRNYMCLAMT